MTEHRGYCSFCFEAARHDAVEKNVLRRNVYRCSKCGQRTLRCRVTGCSAMAKGGEKWDSELCAAHGGEIAGFGRLSMRLETIDQYEALFRREVINVRQAATVSAFVLGGAALIGPLVWCLNNSFTMINLFQDLVNFFGPYERFGLLIV
jgi:hypothetical protein